jgi:hypothetical protein
VAFLSLSLLALACQRDEVAHFRVPKGPSTTTQPASMPMAGGAMGSGGMGEGSDVMASSVPPGPVLKWSLPTGWGEHLTGGMRYATLKAATPGKLDVTVVVLPGPAGGELANVNRWRGQIGLGPIEEAALGAARKRIATKAGPISVYDFISDGERKTRLIAALASSDGNSWFVKMVGDAAPVASARPDFVRLLESLRFEPNP